MLNFISTKTLIMLNKMDGTKPNIVRHVVHNQGYRVTETNKFVKIQDGKRVLYYGKRGNPFHNMYRINSKPGTPDFVTHAVKDWGLTNGGKYGMQTMLPTKRLSVWYTKPYRYGINLIGM